MHLLAETSLFRCAAAASVNHNTVAEADSGLHVVAPSRDVVGIGDCGVGQEYGKSRGVGCVEVVGA